jgi:uncharacterized repeat protein (TIGR03837 family)
VRTLALFCKVVDNFGDIGICWRLARQLVREHGVAVTLWVDDLASFHRICPQVDAAAETQDIDGVRVLHWRGQDGEFSPADIPAIVIEFFGCELPPAYVAAMAQRTPRPVWLNLEGLSAEEWVEGCHGLPSPHPRLPLLKHFFFPGFTAKTGGLLFEADLDDERRRFQSDPAAITAFLGGLGVTPAEAAALKVSLFCYPLAPAAALFDVWSSGAEPVTCLVPEGVASDAVAAIGGRTCGALTVRVLPFMPQADFDRLLWACDLNLARGEDSVVRAQWAGRPFVWQLYPQDDDLHHVKLRAFLQRYAAGLDGLRAFSLAWNGVPAEQGWDALWAGLRREMPAIATHSETWNASLRTLGDLASNLLKFADFADRYDETAV